jgi:hypothetical protein
MKQPDHIEGIKGREPVSAAVTIGVKDRKRGFPIEKDRFHIVLPYEADGRREYHPSFGFFNTAPVDKRKLIMGNLVHASQEECFEYFLKAQVLGKGKAHPNKHPACVGDGSMAVRWEGPGPDDFKKIACPNERCEYRLSTPPSCKPWMRFLFRLRWNDERHPATLVKFTSGSWNTVANFKGFFDYLDRMASELKISDFSLYGLPFTMTLVERTKASAQRRFPTVSISPDMDPVTWLQQRNAAMAALADPNYIALTDDSQQDPAVVFEDMGTISKPANRG